MSPQIACPWKCSHIGCIYSTFLRVWLHLSHWLHLFDFSTHCAFSSVSSNCLPLKMQSHSGCIFSTLINVWFFDIIFMCVFKYPLKLPASVNANSTLLAFVQLCPMFESHTQSGCTLTFLNYAFSKSDSRDWCKVTLVTLFYCLHYGFSNVSSRWWRSRRWKCYLVVIKVISNLKI